MAVIPSRLMSLEQGLEQVNHHLGFLQIGRGILLLVEEVGCGEWLIVEDRATWLECTVFDNFERALRPSERHLGGHRLLGCLYGGVKMPWTWACWPLRLLGWRKHRWQRAVQ